MSAIAPRVKYQRLCWHESRESGLPCSRRTYIFVLRNILGIAFERKISKIRLVLPGAQTWRHYCPAKISFCAQSGFVLQSSSWKFRTRLLCIRTDGSKEFRRLPAAWGLGGRFVNKVIRCDVATLRTVGFHCIEETKNENEALSRSMTYCALAGFR